MRAMRVVDESSPSAFHSPLIQHSRSSIVVWIRAAPMHVRRVVSRVPQDFTVL
jgi:hypothetical protein